MSKGLMSIGMFSRASLLSIKAPLTDIGEILPPGIPR